MTIQDKLNKYNQQHLLRFENELTTEQKQALYSQIESLDFSYLDELNNKQTENKGVISPIKAMTISEINEKKEEFKQIGLKALKNYEVGILLLAGGMGTRLGSDKPKGVFNIGKTKEIYIYQRIFENALKSVKESGCFVPFFIMTSDKTHNETIKFLQEHNYFGYDENYISFFMQEIAPCCDLNGKILLENKYTIATSPNGNGGWFNSILNNKQAKELLEKHNLKWLNVFGVDNVLQGIADPVFIGATIAGNYEVSSKVIRKVDAYEKVGVMCKKDNRPSVIEYIDLTEEMALSTDENGERLYNFGVILNYLFSVDLLYRIKEEKLPVHVVTKKVPYINHLGEKIEPNEPNAHKFELLCVDMVEFGKTGLPFEVERSKEFAPVKNKVGVDSVESAQKLLELNGFVL